MHVLLFIYLNKENYFENIFCQRLFFTCVVFVSELSVASEELSDSTDAEFLDVSAEMEPSFIFSRYSNASVAVLFDVSLQS